MDDMKQRLTSGVIWLRALYMLLYGIAYSIAEVVVSVVVIFQFLAVLLTGRANGNLLKFGNSLSRYIYQIIQFETFNTETLPYPVAPWPVEDVGENRWLAGDWPESAAGQSSSEGGGPSSEASDPRSSP